MKQYYPNISYNKAKRWKYLTLYSLLVLIFGGAAAGCFFSQRQEIAMMGAICLFFVLIFAIMIPSVITGYPVKNKPVIEIDGNKVTVNGNEKLKISDITAVSVCIDVPKQGNTKEEMLTYLKEVASVRPTEAVFGTCDLVCKDKKGKEVAKYTYIEDCLGALENLVEAGVKKYRIVYSMKRINCLATYRINLTPSGNSKYDALSEKDRMMQLM